jgi:PAS domain S-box/diguanylate cyclase (GGDEF) domain
MHDVASSQPNLEKIVDAMESGILCCKNDAVLTIAYANSCFYNMLGYQPEELSSLLNGQPEGVLCDDPPIDWAALGKELEQGGFSDQKLKLYRKDGHHIWAAGRFRLMEDDGQEFFCVVLHDITEERRSQKIEHEQFETVRKAEMELADSEKRYRIIMEQAADPIFDYDLKTQNIYCSPSFQKRFDFEVKAGRYLFRLEHADFIHEEDRKRALSDVRTALKKGTATQIGEYRLKLRNGRYCWHRVRSTIIRNESGHPVHVIIFFTDIDKQKNETLLLREQAERDLLTGLYNHVTTTQLIDKAIQESADGTSHALFVIDIDDFKDVNDRLGHLYGDELLEEVSTKLKEQFREEDIVGRIGGDEFVVFLRNLPSEKILRMKSRILNDLFRGVKTNGTIACRVSCSVGVALYPKDGTNYHELFLKADVAMYAAKRSGKDVFCVYSAELDSESR